MIFSIGFSPVATGCKSETTALFSKPEPNEFGSWRGGRYSVWVNAESKQILHYELADGIASSAPKVSSDVQVTTVFYDETIKVEVPKEQHHST